MARQETFKYDLAVVGLGYVGLPLLEAAAKSKARVIGYDTREAHVLSLIESFGSFSDEELTIPNFTATAASLRDAENICVCVPTPLDASGAPDLSFVRDAAETIGGVLRDGQLIVLESTTFPGTTEGVFREVLETTSGMTAGINFEIAYSPERIDPGNKTFGISNTPKLVGGLSGRATERAVNLYSRFIDTVIPASSAKAAESAKLLENTFRHVNIAFVNEFAMACNALGVDVFEVIDLAASKPFGFQRFVPGAGAGGHCIPVDPNYLVHSLRLIGDENYTSILFSNEVNERVASYLCNQVAEFLNQNAQPDSTSRVVAVLGLTYKPDTQDDRESPAERIIPGLESIASEILVHDPHITSRDYWHGYKMIREERFEECLERADCILVLQPHSKYLEQAAFLNKFESKSILAFRGVELEARHAYEPTI